ncbi:MAG TPA: DNA polymerase II large subunit [Candidatus Nanopelagicaceae bacterium]|nr:DNA polymerase II large subunit [Candidatus Nanopelagicaceae bacterium]
MVEMSNKVEDYFSLLQRDVDKCYEIAEKARKKGLDPETFVESPQAKDLAGRVEKLVGPKGVADVIRFLKNQGKNEDEIVFQVVSDILSQKVVKIESLEERVERAIRVGLAIKTMGVVSAPLEGISKILIREDQHNNKYLSLYFAGPIRAAGGTTAALCVLIADYVRKRSNIPKYEATEGEIGRYVEEVKLYDRRGHLQYPSSNDEIRYAVEHLPVEINGDATEDEEVSAFRGLPRIETNKIRGGACLVLNDGILLKAPKLLKIAQNMKLEGWNWLGKLKDIAQKEEKVKKNDDLESKSTIKITPNSKYISDIIAGRPVFSDPSKIGGHRIRYGRSRNTGLAAGGLHPATMAILDGFIAIGTQLRIERPGKSTSICPVTSIEPPIIKLKNGNVVRISNAKKATALFQDIKEILFLGDILFGFGEFSENNHKLVPSGYVEEWWALELEEALKIEQRSNKELSKFIEDPFNNIPSAKEAIDLAKNFAVPLHPKYTDFWGNISVSDLSTLREALTADYDNKTKKINLKNSATIKDILERAFVPHTVNENCIFLDNATTEIYETIFNLNRKEFVDMKNEDNVFNYFSSISPIEIRNKAPYYMGTRMGRPEKSERKSMKGVQSLFPLSDQVGNTRSVQKAIDLGRIKIDICRKKCPNCSFITPFNLCPECGSHTEFQKICLKCNKYYTKNEEKCQQCGGVLNFSKEASFNIKNYSKTILSSLNMSIPDKFKGILGLTNQFKVPEPLMKGILRAKNGLLVYKTAEIRYDATDIPLTHFKPKEITTPVSRLIELGYELDYKANELNNENQILELQVQDVILSDDCAKYFIKIANFIDDELELFYNLDTFYNITKREDLIGHLAVGLAPHTSAGIVGRIIGFSPARSIYAHPFWHAAKRRNCDGDEDGIMLLLDPLLNFSRYYLPSKIGGRMDATLVISSLLDPNEIDSEAHNIDTLFKYPLEFYKATQEYLMPFELEKKMNLVRSRLGTPAQYENLGFNIPTNDINDGPTTTAYKTYASMEEKINAQLHLAKIIRAVNDKNVAEKILTTHFNPDIMGNLRKFAVQHFRCVKCNEKYRRPPLSNAGKCLKCGGNVILTVNRGGIEKYIPKALKISRDFNLDAYTIQRMELVKEYVESLTNNPKIKQQKLSNFF